MNNLTIEMNGVAVQLSTNTDIEMDILLSSGMLDEYLKDKLYFSKSQKARTGNGWIPFSEMANEFIYNAYKRKMLDLLTNVFEELRTSGDLEAQVAFLSDAQEFIEIVTINSDEADEGYKSALVLSSLYTELNRRLMNKKPEVANVKLSDVSSFFQYK